MFGWFGKGSSRRRQVREHRARTTETFRGRVIRGLFSWPFVTGAVFLVLAAAVAMIGESGPGYAVGQFVPQPLYAEVEFQLRDPKRTAADRDAARAATPSYYVPNTKSSPADRVRADALRLYQAAADAETFEAFSATLGEWGWPAEPIAYTRLRGLLDAADDRGKQQFLQWIDALPLDREYVVAHLLKEPRVPESAAEYIVVESSGADGSLVTTEVRLSQVVSQGSDRGLHGSAAEVARRFAAWELRPIIEAIVRRAFRDQPTLVFNQDRTLEKMREAESKTPDALTTYEKGKPYLQSGVLGSEGLELIRAHHEAYLTFLRSGKGEALPLRQVRLLQQSGWVVITGIVALGFLLYTHIHLRRIFEAIWRTVAYLSLITGSIIAARLLHLQWPHLPELIIAPCLFMTVVLTIAYPRRFALGSSWIAAVLITVVVRGDLAFFLTLSVGVAVAIYQLNEIRYRTKLIVSGAVTAVAVGVAAAATGFGERHTVPFVVERAMWAAGSALLAAFVVSGVLPFIERLFRIATSLTLLEWRDPTRPLLQLLAHEAPGTYNHSLVVGQLAEAACEAIGANGLLAQVGSLYHDIGKIHKAEYFAENQEGRINRHEKLAPTMSLLIILGHVKDGIEMAREYKLPRVLHQFIEEHHGTTVVRYFHQMASQRQPRVSSGRHDREVSEAEFRYAGPKPRLRESAVVMLCDGIEGAVRALPEPTLGRIEAVVHEVITDRLSDGQFDDCDITLREINKVAESLVKSLYSIYHTRIAYPKSRKPKDEAIVPRTASI